ncbi:MAG TPA: TlpA disulfide reductase family protein [Puia sp.]|nr:TlpA disulfide reductase family protein [Puia sp.]
MYFRDEPNVYEEMKQRMALILFALAPLAGFCQQSFSVKLHFPFQPASRHVSIFYDNGKFGHSVPVEEDSTVTISDSLFGRYAGIQVYCADPDRKGNDFYNSFWVEEKPAEITFVADDAQKDPLQHVVLKNAWATNDMGRRELDSFQRVEASAFRDFLLAHPGPLTDSAIDTAKILGKRLFDKTLLFIREHPDKYYSIYLFRSELTQNSLIDADSLLQFYNSVFPDSLKHSFDGREALAKINVRLNTGSGHKASEYLVRDIHGKEVSSAANRGKYVLLDFWASWCVPCVESMPTIKKLRERYGEDRLVIISVSLDDKRKAFDEALKKHGMTWTQVYGPNDIRKGFSFNGIPEVILIDPHGYIVYDRQEKGKEDPDLTRLVAMLNEKLR